MISNSFKNCYQQTVIIYLFIYFSALFFSNKNEAFFFQNSGIQPLDTKEKLGHESSMALDQLIDNINLTSEIQDFSHMTLQFSNDF